MFMCTKAEGGIFPAPFDFKRHSLCNLLNCFYLYHSVGLFVVYMHADLKLFFTVFLWGFSVRQAVFFLEFISYLKRCISAAEKKVNVWS